MNIYGRYRSHEMIICNKYATLRNINNKLKRSLINSLYTLMKEHLNTDS